MRDGLLLIAVFYRARMKPKGDLLFFLSLFSDLRHK